MSEYDFSEYTAVDWQGVSADITDSLDQMGKNLPSYVYDFMTTAMDMSCSALIRNVQAILDNPANYHDDDLHDLLYSANGIPVYISIMVPFTKHLSYHFGGDRSKMLAHNYIRMILDLDPFV